jgi:hypothetical protein
MPARRMPGAFLNSLLDCPHPYKHIPKYVEVPPNIEAKRIISYFYAVLSY